MFTALTRPTRFALLRDAADGGAGGGADGGDAGEAGGAAGAAAPDLSFMGDEFKGEDGAYDVGRFAESYNGTVSKLAQLQEAADARTAGIPENADGYEMAVPEDIDFGELDLPEGFKFELEADHPLLGELREWMHGVGVPAEKSGEMMGLIAKYEAHKAAHYKGEHGEEMTKLGAHGVADRRISEVRRGLETRIPDQAQRDALLNNLTTADAVRAVEALLSVRTGTPPNPSTKLKGDVEGMTALDRLKLANTELAASGLRRRA